MTHLRAILAIARKDALDIVLDRAKIGGVLIPLALTLLFLLIGNVLNARPTTIVVYNPGQSPVEQIVTRAFDSYRITEVSSPADVSAAFGANGTHKNATYDIGLVVPADFEHSLQSGNHPQVELYFNGSAIGDQQSFFLQAAVTNYARTVAAPTPPANVVTATINPQTPQTSTSVPLSKYYSYLVLPFSLVVGITLMPALLIEEKEKKTLRMLMVSPASFSDVLLGKLLVALGYQVAISSIVLALMGGFANNTPLLLLYILLGSSFALAIGLFLGSILQSAGAAGGLETPFIFAFVIPAVFIPLEQYLGSSPIVSIIKILPTYYFAAGVHNAIQMQGSFGGNVLDIGVTVGCIIALFLLSLWALRRQSAAAATI